MTKYLGIILASIFSVILIVEVTQVNAQVANEPITGPLTSPLTSPMGSLTPTITPTPTLINTLTSTPILTETVTPSVTLTPTMTPTPTLTVTPTPTEIISPTPTISVTPTVTIIPTDTVTPTPTVTPVPLPVGSTKLGGLNLDGYCAAVAEPWDILINNTWSCDNGNAPIDMTAACQWQYNQSGVLSNQDIPNDPYSWACYVPQGSISSTPTVSPTETITPTVTMELTVTPTPSDVTPSITPVATTTPTPSSDISPTMAINPTTAPAAVKIHHRKVAFSFPFIHFPKGFPFVINAANFFKPHHEEKPMSRACSIHDKH